MKNCLGIEIGHYRVKIAYMEHGELQTYVSERLETENQTDMKVYAELIKDVLKENNITKVYYYDVIEDRTKKTKNFRQIEDLLSKYLKITDMGAEYLFTPALIFVKDGKIINYDDETSLVSFDMRPDTYWNEDAITSFHNKINTYLSEADYK